ncbi:MAG: hypothetical protein ACO20H_11120 [Bacteriovoracaceae bacterium]
MADENKKDPSDLENIEEEIELESEGTQVEESSEDLSQKTEAKEFQTDDPDADSFDDLSNVHYGGEKVNASAVKGALGGGVSAVSEEEEESAEEESEQGPEDSQQAQSIVGGVQTQGEEQSEQESEQDQTILRSDAGEEESRVDEGTGEGEGAEGEQRGRSSEARQAQQQAAGEATAAPEGVALGPQAAAEAEAEAEEEAAEAVAEAEAEAELEAAEEEQQQEEDEEDEVVAEAPQGEDDTTTTGPDTPPEPEANVFQVSGEEDTSISLDLSESLSSIEGQSAMLRINNIPEGATLSDGSNSFTSSADSAYADITSWDLGNLSIIPAANSDEDFALEFVSVSINGDGAQSVTESTYEIDVNGVADVPTIEVQDVSIELNSAILLPLEASLTDTDGSEVLGLTLSGIPEGTIMVDGENIYYNIPGSGIGSLDLTNWNLDQIVFIPPNDGTYQDFDLTFTATATELGSGDQESVSQIFSVDITNVASDPIVSVQDVTGYEDNAISLDISAGLSDRAEAEGESLTVSLSNIPEGATLSDGEFVFYANSDNASVDITNWNLDNLSITPPENSSEDMNLNLTATSEEIYGGETSVSQSFNIDVIGVADEPVVQVSNAELDAGEGVALNLSAELTDDSETLSAFISNIPDDVTLSDGTNSFTAGDGNNSIDVSNWDLSNLNILAPSDAEGEYVLNFSATSSEPEGDSLTVTKSFTVTINNDDVVAEPIINAVDVTGFEDSAIALDLSATAGDPGDIVQLTLFGLPEGATLTDGSNTFTVPADNSSFDISDWNLSSLSIKPSENSNEDINLTLNAQSFDGDNASLIVSDSFTIDVVGVADEPIIDVENVSGNEDSSILLDLAVSLPDGDGSEELAALTLSGMPEGAILSDGDNTATIGSNGSLDILGWDLDSISITPPENSNEDMNLTLSAQSLEDDGDLSDVVTGNFNVEVDGVVDGLTLDLGEAFGIEDNSIALSIDLNKIDSDGSEEVSIEISGVPDGASLSAGLYNSETDTWELSEQDLSNLSINPAPNSDETINLEITVTSTENDSGDSVSTTGNLEIDVTADADVPILTINQPNIQSTEDQLIDLNFSADLTDIDQSEILSVEISGVPQGAVLNHGVYNETNQTWTLSQSDLNSLKLTPPENSSEDFTLSIKVTATEESNQDSESVFGTIEVSLAPDADAPTLILSNASGVEDSAIPLNITADLTDLDGSESLSIEISGVPVGASLNKGEYDESSNKWVLDKGDLIGLEVTPAENSDEDFVLSVSVTATESEGGDTAVTSGVINVSVAPDADAPTLIISDAAGDEDSAIPLSISSELTDSSELLSINISDIPEGATLSAGTPNSDGSYTLTPAQLDGLTITPPENSDEDFTLNITAISTESDGSTSSVTQELDVNVAAVADEPYLHASFGEGVYEDAKPGQHKGADGQGAIGKGHYAGDEITYPINIETNLTDTDGSENLSVQISGLPEGSELSSGTHLGDGVYLISLNDLDNLELIVPADYEGEITLDIAAISTETDGGDQAITSTTISTDEMDLADEADLEVEDAQGAEDSAIALDIKAELNDLEGETLTVTIENIPEGAVLSAGELNNDGSVTLAPEDLANLTITPAPDSSEDFDLKVIATTTENGSSVDVEKDLHVEVLGVADAPEADIPNDIQGSEDSPIPLNITAGLTDLDGSESLSIEISGVPVGASLNKGEYDSVSNKWILDKNDLNGLKVFPAEDSADNFELSVSVIATESDSGDTAVTSGVINVSVDPEADAPTLEVSGATGDEDTAISLSISPELTDSSELLSINISDIPEGATLSVGTPNSDGSYTLTPAQLDGLTITPAENSDEDFTLQISAISTESDGSTSTTTQPLQVSVTAVVDSIESSTPNETDIVAGDDSSIGLTINASLIDADGSEILHAFIDGIPEGFELTDGVNSFTATSGEGNIDISDWNINTLTLNPSENYDGEISLIFTAYTKELNTGEESNLLVRTFNITIDNELESPDISVEPVVGNEDEALPINITLDSVEDTIVTIDNVPNGAFLTDGNNTFMGSENINNIDISDWNFDTLTITPPENSNQDFNLTINAYLVDDESISDSSTFLVDVIGVADGAEVTVLDVSGAEDSAINLSIAQSLLDNDGSETLSGFIGGIPDGAIITDGVNVFEASPGENSTDVTDWNISNLQIIPPENESGDFTLSFTSKSTENEEVNPSTASVTKCFIVQVSPVADEPILNVTNVTGDEDSAIPLSIGVDVSDSSEQISSLMIGDIPDSAVLTDGINVFVAGSDHGNSVDVSSWDVDSISLTPPENDDSDFTLNVSATSQDGESFNTVNKALHVNVDGVADEPLLSFSLTPIEVDDKDKGHGNENDGVDADNPGNSQGLPNQATENRQAEFEPEYGNEYEVTIDIEPSDKDGSERIGEIKVEGLPEGASLSNGTENDDGSWSLQPNQLEGLKLSLPDDYDDSFTLSINAVVEELENGEVEDSADFTAQFEVDPDEIPMDDFMATDYTFFDGVMGSIENQGTDMDEATSEGNDISPESSILEIADSEDKQEVEEEVAEMDSDADQGVGSDIHDDGCDDDGMGQAG